jgi:chromosomal replication initiator protein
LARLYRNHPDHAAAALSGILPNVVDLEPPDAPSVIISEVEAKKVEEDQEKQVRISRIIEHVADYFHVSPIEVCGESRALRIVYPRQIAIYLSREYTFQSWNRIGRKFGNRDHTTILHSWRKITAQFASNPSIESDVTRIRAKIAQSLQ